MTKRTIVANWAWFFNFRSEADQLRRMWDAGLMTWDQFLGSMGG